MYNLYNNFCDMMTNDFFIFVTKNLLKYSFLILMAFLIQKEYLQSSHALLSRLKLIFLNLVESLTIETNVLK